MDRDVRHEKLRERFVRAFGGSAPTHLARAPGRVNLIGEHTDYNGLPVFPMAIQRNVAIAFRARADERVRVCNVDDRHGEREFTIEDAIPPFERGDWGNYVKAAAQMLRERAGIPDGIDAAVDGDIPAAAGLSSSSALVVASALALMSASRVEIDRLELMALLARAERYVGTQSGGMDQAISLGGRAGDALMIEFEPLRLTPVHVPGSWCFVVANSLVRAEKSGAAQRAYNVRTAECRDALLAFAADDRIRRLLRAAGRAEDDVPSYAALVRDVATQALLEIANTALSDPLRGRFRHVVTEAARVDAARRAMDASDLAAFGRAMNASHASLRDDYAVSCVELDRLVEAACAAGCAGARLTGAGFGGCIVALCDRDRSAVVVEALRDELAHRTRASTRDAVWIAEPSDGARVEAL
jgi:galactokinase